MTGPSVPEKMLAVLSDGLPHTRAELFACLWDTEGRWDTVSVHLCAIRKTLRPRGEDIICQFFNRSYYYRHIRLLSSANDGRA